MEKNNLFEKLFLFKQKIYLNQITFVQFKQNILGPNKYFFKLNQFFLRTNKLLHSCMVKDIIFSI